MGLRLLRAGVPLRRSLHLALSRTRFPYEKTSEFKRKNEAGQSPYPARAPWYPAVDGLSSERLARALSATRTPPRCGSTT